MDIVLIASLCVCLLGCLRVRDVGSLAIDRKKVCERERMRVGVCVRVCVCPLVGY